MKPSEQGSISESEDKVDLAQYARIVWKRKWMVLLPTALVLLTTWIGLRFVTPLYRSYAIIEIIDQDVVEALADEFAAGRRPGRDRTDDSDERVGELNQQVTGPRFLTPVGKRLGLDKSPGIMAAAQQLQVRLPDLKLDDLVVNAYTAQLKSKIIVEEAGISQYKFIAEDEDPQFAYALAREVAEEYLDYTLEQGIEVVDRTQAFSTEQLERYRRELTKAENQLQAKQRELQGRALITQNPITADNFFATRRLVDEADLETATLEQRMEKGLDRLPPALRKPGVLESKVASSSVASLSDMLRQAELNQVPLVIQGQTAGGVVESEVSRTRQELFAEIQDRVAQAFPTESQAVQNQIRDIVFDRRTLVSVRARRQIVQEYLNNYSAGVVRAPGDDIELRRMQDQVDRYRQLVANIEERRNTDDLRRNALEASVSSRVKVIELPQVPLKPAWPDRARVLLLALFAGPLLGLGAVMVIEFMDTSLKTVEEIEQELGLPVLGTIPRLIDVNRQPRRPRRGRRRSAIESAGAAGRAGAGG